MSLVRFADPLKGNVLTGGDPGFVVAEWQDSGGAFDPPRWIAPLHLHRSDDEAWYVLEGALCVRMGDEDVELWPVAVSWCREARRTRIGIHPNNGCATCS